VLQWGTATERATLVVDSRGFPFSTHISSSSLTTYNHRSEDAEVCQAPTKRSSGDASVTVSRPGGCHVESRWPPPMCRPSQLGGQRSHSFFQLLLPTCGCAHTGCEGGKSAPYTHPATGSLRQVAGPWPLAIRARARSGRGSAQALQRVSCALPRSVQEGTREACQGR